MIKIKQAHLKRAIDILKQSTKVGGDIEDTAYILFEVKDKYTLTLWATNMLTFVKVPVECLVTKKISPFLIKAERLSVIDYWGDNILIRPSKDKIVLSSESKKLEVPARQTVNEYKSNFPTMPTNPEKITTKNLPLLLIHTAPICGVNHHNPVVNGVHLRYSGSTLEIEATDGLRGIITCSKARSSKFKTLDVVFEKSFSNVLGNLETIIGMLFVTDSHLFYVCKEGTFITILLDGNFPDMSSLFNQAQDVGIMCNTEELKETLQVAGTIGNFITIYPNGKTVTESDSGEVYDSYLSVQCIGHPPTITLDINHLSYMARYLTNEEEVALYYNSSSSVMIFSNDRYSYVSTSYDKGGGSGD